ncbi:MAG: acyl-CoA dehydrogenase family protein [SAR202 cluster bacterium]|nr:acyl-CoA dehydrogenase family protein [SAR202 cluster bacterium]
MLDYYNISALLTPEERQIQESVRRFLDTDAVPEVSSWWERGEFPMHLLPGLSKLGIIGANLPKNYGGASVSNIAYGLIMYELERVDSGLRSFVSVQSSLCMEPIMTYGSEEQKRKFLPQIAAGQVIGCFGLTEHSGGSDPNAMQTRAQKDGDQYVLNGTKMWISLGSIADFAIIWAKDQNDAVRGFIVPTDTQGFVATTVPRTMSLRIAGASELILEDVRIPADHMLPAASTLSAPLSCLTHARYGIAWGAMGALESVYSEALAFAKSRTTFGQPIASRQLVQEKLSTMLSDHTSGLLRALRLGQLKDTDQITYSQVSLAKRENVRGALRGARLGRELLGGSGITLDHSVIRHMLNLETVDTYEGTHDIHTLIIGRDITGIQALS